MLETLTNILDVLYVILDMCILTLYFRIFFKIRECPKYVIVSIYTVGFAMYTCSSLFFSMAYQRTITYLCVCLLLSMAYTGPVLYKSILTLCYSALGIFVEDLTVCVIVLLYDFFPILQNRSIEYPMGVIISCCIFLTLVICIAVMWKKVFNGVNRFKYILKNRSGVLIFFLIGIMIFFSMVVNYMALRQRSNENIAIFFVLELLLIIFVVGIFFVFREMERLQEDKMQAALLHQQNRAQELFYKESIDKNKQLKKIIHDEKNFLIGISGLLKQQKTDTAIEELERKVEQLVSNTTDYTGNIALDTILTTKVEEARTFNIILRPAIALFGNINVDFLDLVLILGNALDNAIEATKQVEAQEQRIIYATMKLQENFLSIEVRNPIKEKVLIENNRVQTTKEDKLLHGLGLGNIQMLAEKYNGSMLIKSTDSMFQLSVLLQNESVEDK